MNHDAAHDKLLELEYGELSPREAREVAAHAEGCAACREALAAIRETRAIMSGLPAEPAPERGEAILMAAAREAAAARRPRPLLPAWLWAGAAGAMAAAVVAVVSWQLASAPGAGPREARQDELLGGAPSASPARPEPALATTEPAPTPEGTAVRDAAPSTAEVRGEVASVPASATPPAKAARARVTAKAAVPEAEGRLERAPEPARKPAERERAEALAPEPFEAARAKREAPAALPGPAPSAAWRSVPAETEEGAFGGSFASPPAPAPSAPPPVPAASGGAAQTPAARQAVRSAASAERKMAAPAAMAEARDEAMRGAEAPDGAVGVVVETRDAPGCNGEIRRIVERDTAGRVVRYVRVGERREVDQRYGPDGRLVAAFEIIGLVTRSLPLDAPGLVLHARDARIDAPLRCGAP